MSLLTTNAMAQATNDPKPPKALADMVSRGAQVYYLGQVENMNGWALVRQGKPEFFYENADRTAMVMGLLFNKDGEMLTTSQLSALKRKEGDGMFAATGGMMDFLSEKNTAQNEATPSPKSNEAPVANIVTPASAPAMDRAPTSAERMYVDLLGSNWITLNGDGAQDLFVIIDPDCPHCRQFITEVEPLLTPDGLRVRIIPIGAREESLRRASLLLASADPAELLVKYAKEEAELNAPENIDTTAAEKNLALMGKYGFDVTPMVIYRTGKGEIRLIRGRPSNYQNILNDIQNN